MTLVTLVTRCRSSSSESGACCSGARAVSARIVLKASGPEAKGQAEQEQDN